METFLKRRAPAVAPNGTGPVFTPSAADAASHPALVEFLVSERWPDGSPRRPGTVLVFYDDGRLKVCLSDRDQGVVAFAVAEGVAGLLDAAEGLLRDPRADWRAQRSTAPRSSGRK